MKLKKGFTGWLLLFIAFSAFAGQKDKANEIRKESLNTIQQFKKKDPGISRFFNLSYGYVVFPHIGKGGLGIGAGNGKGTLFKHGKAVGNAKITQVTIGLQAGVQKYSEVIFFKDKTAFDRFVAGNYEFSAQVSAVALKSGISKDAEYRDGVLVFTLAQGGLMYEASVGGQKFKVQFYSSSNR